MKEHRSLFWPLTFIAAGILWLLISLGQMPSENLWALTHIWPYLLIAFGAGLILRGLWRPLSSLVTILVVVGIFCSVYFAPQLGWNNTPEWTPWKFGEGFGMGGVSGSGVVKTETRKVSGFEALALDYPAEVTIQQGASESLTIEAEENLLPQLATEVRNGTLHIESNERDYSKRVNPTKIIRITITVKNLREIDFSSAGKLTLNGLKGDSLKVYLSGAGDVTLNNLKLQRLTAGLSGAGKFTMNGAVTDLKLTLSGLGNLEAADLTAQTADIEISGAGSATLRCEERLNVTISGAGSVSYYGSPEVIKSISGAGDVKQAGQ